VFCGAIAFSLPPDVGNRRRGNGSFTSKANDLRGVSEVSSMRAEPREFQCATPTGSAEQAADHRAEVDPSQIHVFAGDRIDAANSILSGWDGGSAPNLAHIGDIKRIGTGSIGRLKDILEKLRASVTVRSSSIGGALVLAFGLGWACALLFDSNPVASLPPLDQTAPVPLGRLDSEKQVVRRSHSIASAAAAPAPGPAPTESNKPKLSASAASARPGPSGAAQTHADLQGLLSRIMQDSRPSPQAVSASSDSNPPLPLSPVPETKPATIPGWTVREVYGENAVLVGPDHIWTVRTGDSVPGVGRIDTIVRWGNRWIVATTTGLISTE
jgi:hypothetical protein